MSCYLESKKVCSYMQPGHPRTLNLAHSYDQGCVQCVFDSIWISCLCLLRIQVINVLCPCIMYFRCAFHLCVCSQGALWYKLGQRGLAARDCWVAANHHQPINRYVVFVNCRRLLLVHARVKQIGVPPGNKSLQKLVNKPKYVSMGVQSATVTFYLHN